MVRGWEYLEEEAMREQAREDERAIVWVTEDTFIRLPLEPVLTLPPGGPKLFAAEKITLKPLDAGDAEVVVVNVTIDGGS